MQPICILKGVEPHSVSLQDLEGVVQVRYVVIYLKDLHQHVIYIDLHHLPDEVCEHFVYKPLICGLDIFQPKGIIL